jgi:hypothetical protein
VTVCFVDIGGIVDHYSDRERFLLNGPMAPSSKFQWESYLKECTDIDIMSSSFTQKYLEIISRNIPSKMIQVRPSDKPCFKRSTCLYCQTLRIYVFLIEYGILILIIVAL